MVIRALCVVDIAKKVHIGERGLEQRANSLQYLLYFSLILLLFNKEMILKFVPNYSCQFISKKKTTHHEASEANRVSPSYSTTLGNSQSHVFLYFSEKPL